MNNFTRTLYDKMNEELRHIAVDQEDKLQQVEQSCHVVEKFLKELRDFVISYSFKDEEEEISFFKEEKPKFLKEYIYYAEVFYIESNRPVGDYDIQKNYLEHNLERIHIFFQRNNYLYTYYRTAKAYLDHVFFLRNAEEIPLLPAYSVDIDPRFSTVYSFKLSKLMAFEQIHDYLYRAIVKQDTLTEVSATERKAGTITWTASKAELIELAYALQSSGTFNFGKADVKQVVTALENSFNIQVGNFYRVFQGQRIRKKSRTLFLDSLKENLVRRMDESDLNPRGY